MANISSILKEEISRLARKEIKAQTATTKKATVQQRHEIAELKRQLEATAKKLTFLESRERERLTGKNKDTQVLSGTRISTRSVRAQRRRAGLSAEDYGKLLGVSGQTIYLWEQGKARPRKSQLAALVAIRGIGRREAKARMALLKSADQGEGAKPTPRKKK